MFVTFVCCCIVRAKKMGKGECPGMGSWCGSSLCGNGISRPTGRESSPLELQKALTLIAGKGSVELNRVGRCAG